MKLKRLVLPLAMAIAGIEIFLVGCAEQGSTPSAANSGDQQTTAQAKSSQPTGQTDLASDASEEHAHKPGAHGGIIVPIGRDSYHAEAIFGKDGALSLYMLGADESKVIDVENQTLAAYVKAASTAETTPIELKPSPQDGDGEGKTSRFAGTLPESFWGAPVEVTIPSIRIGADRFRLGFSSVIETQHGDAMMPDKVTSKEEQDLYLTPGGIYTQADIDANGNVTASQKFAGFMSAHDMKPKAGDKICPVTMTKANPLVAWIIGGKTYEFCCPPCVDEFVEMAKTDPGSIKAPDEYVKK